MIVVACGAVLWVVWFGTLVVGWFSVRVFSG